MSAGTADTAFVDETYDPSEVQETEPESGDHESPYAARALDRINGEAQAWEERIPPWRHDGLAPNWGNGQ